MKTKHLITAIIAVGAVSLSSCGGAKNAAPKGEEFVNSPCSGEDFLTDKKFFRASSSAIGWSQATAQQNAINNATVTLAQQINQKVKAVMDSYSNVTRDGQLVYEVGDAESLSQIDIKLSIQSSKPICIKTTRIIDKGVNDGKYMVYASVEKSIEDIYNQAVERISQDAKDKIKFSKEKFRERFDMEMAKN